VPQKEQNGSDRSARQADQRCQTKAWKTREDQRHNTRHENEPRETFYRDFIDSDSRVPFHFNFLPISLSPNYHYVPNLFPVQLKSKPLIEPTHVY
jgi:hypothetical protein